MANQKGVATLPVKDGMYMHIRGSEGYDLVTKSLDSARGDYVLLNVRQEEGDKGATSATLYLPQEHQARFGRKLESYAEGADAVRKPPNAALVDSMEDIKLAAMADFWTDDPQYRPGEELKWCEVWLRDNKNREAVSRFQDIALHLDIEYNTDKRLDFPERTVILARVNQDLFERLLVHSPDIAECRLAREAAMFFTKMPNREQADWIGEFLKHVNFVPNTSVSVCLLDTGVNHGHPLLQPILSAADIHSADSAWSTSDLNGHGTNMAGIAAYGDMAEAMAGPGGVTVSHVLESCKILPSEGDNPPELWGFLTAQGVARAEDAAPQRKRQICMAVTAAPSYPQGEPSSWSAAVDALASGAYEDAQSKRLILVSAGNATEDEFSYYPDTNLTQSVQDPGQAWNALTIGAYTEFDEPGENLQGYTPLARSGQLSPHSTTSGVWASQWPYKPDVVFEGGNVARDETGRCEWDDSLCVLTTSHRVETNLLTSFWATSAATAQAAWFAAQIQARYPAAWPETVRALMVHSAQWPESMLQQFVKEGRKRDYQKLCRICGYGVPQLENALYCLNNSLVLVAEREIQPYIIKDNGKDGMQMHLFELPWPKEILQELGEQDVTLRVTLSYFIEPGPGKRGWKDKYRYASFGLRFALCHYLETKEQFVNRISHMEERDADVPASDSRWLIGANVQKSGSVHSNMLNATAAEIANCNLLAIYPVVGWWRLRAHLGKKTNMARYSLVVSLHTDETTVDIYTPVKLLTETAVTAPVPILV